MSVLDLVAKCPRCGLLYTVSCVCHKSVIVLALSCSAEKLPFVHVSSRKLHFGAHFHQKAIFMSKMWMLEQEKIRYHICSKKNLLGHYYGE